MRNLIAVIAAVAPGVVLACQPQMERRAVNAARQLDRSSEAAEAQITDMQEECSYYNYEPVNEIVSLERAAPSAKAGPLGRPQSGAAHVGPLLSRPLTVTLFSRFTRTRTFGRLPTFPPRASKLSSRVPRVCARADRVTGL